MTEISARQKLDQLLARAAGGDLAAMTDAALLLVKGAVDLPKDPGRAFELYRRAAEAGYTMAQFNLGCMYMEGLAVARHPEQAETWLKLAADAGDCDAQFTLATLYERYPAGRDPAEARLLYEKAAEAGSARAQYDLACIYMHGRGTAVDREKAIHWFERAEKSGVSRAAAHLKELRGS